MSISLNSIIHYTNKIHKLKSILSEGFKVKYCAEEIYIKDKKTIDGAFPMVCFCDIPLTKAKDHLDAYGCYGIGLSKSWAITNGLNPVLYIEKHSDIAEILHTYTYDAIYADKELKKLDAYIKICSYLKNYDGILVRQTKKINDYRFYDEREWRYVPKPNLLEGSNAIKLESYLANKRKYNLLAEKIKLKFSHSDISYIIVHNEKEIPQITKHLRDCYADKCTSVELEILLTRIITTNQIIKDF